MIRYLAYIWYKWQVLKQWNSHDLSMLVSSYEKWRQRIHEIYSVVDLWHGTGRYHYRVVGTNKYVGQVDTTNKEDVLGKMIKNGGITPFDDPWVKCNRKYAQSISTTTWKSYARIYAELHCTEETRPKLTFGDRLHVMKFFTYYSLASVPIIGWYKAYSAGYKDQMRRSSGPVWAATINNSLRTKGNAYSDLFAICGKALSNIEGNYGLLFGIKKNRNRSAYIHPLVAMFETRLLRQISFKDITHVEVPMCKVLEVTDMLSEHGVNIPVLPLELCEMYMAEQPFNYQFNRSMKLPHTSLLSFIKHYHGNGKKIRK